MSYLALTDLENRHALLREARLIHTPGLQARLCSALQASLEDIERLQRELQRRPLQACTPRRSPQLEARQPVAD
ncbi:hypothetical protein [Thiomonas sp.]